MNLEADRSPEKRRMAKKRRNKRAPRPIPFQKSVLFISRAHGFSDILRELLITLGCQVAVVQEIRARVTIRPIQITNGFPGVEFQEGRQYLPVFFKAGLVQ